MNTEIQQSNAGPGSWIAFLIGGVLNYILASINYEKVLEHALITLVGGVISGFLWLVFRILYNKVVNSNQRSQEKDSDGE